MKRFQSRGSWIAAIGCAIFIFAPPSPTLERNTSDYSARPHAAFPFSDPPSASVDMRKDGQRVFDFTYVVRVPRLSGEGGVLRIWLPLPQSDTHQTITNLRIAAPVPYHVYDQPQFENRAAYFALNSKQTASPFEITLSFRAVRRQYRVVLPSDDPSENEAFAPGVARFLLPDKLVPIDGIIGELSQEQTEGVSDPLARARKIYDYVIAHMHYDHNGSGWGRGDAIFACTQHHGNCTDFHSLFIGMARAAGIPARFEIGFSLPPAKISSMTSDTAKNPGKRQSEISPSVSVDGYHCWAEFYISGTGWIPIDASEAWQIPAKHNFFFGALDEHRIRFSRGRDLGLNPPQAAGPLNYFVYPYAELDGKPFMKLSHTFSFRNVTGISRRNDR